MVGQRIAFVPGGVSGFGRAYFEVPNLPAADHYRVITGRRCLLGMAAASSAVRIGNGRVMCCRTPSTGSEPPP